MARLCLATQSTLHLVKPLGFSLDDRQLKRAGLDYWKDVDVKIWDSLEELRNAPDPKARYFFVTTKAHRVYHEQQFHLAISWCLAARPKGCPKVCWPRTAALRDHPDARNAQSEPRYGGGYRAFRSRPSAGPLIREKHRLGPSRTADCL